MNIVRSYVFRDDDRPFFNLDTLSCPNGLPTHVLEVSYMEVIHPSPIFYSEPDTSSDALSGRIERGEAVEIKQKVACNNNLSWISVDLGWQKLYWFIESNGEEYFLKPIEDIVWFNRRELRRFVLISRISIFIFGGILVWIIKSSRKPNGDFTIYTEFSLFLLLLSIALLIYFRVDAGSYISEYWFGKPDKVECLYIPSYTNIVRRFALTIWPNAVEMIEKFCEVAP